MTFLDSYFFDMQHIYLARKEERFWFSDIDKIVFRENGIQEFIFLTFPHTASFDVFSEIN